MPISRMVLRQPGSSPVMTPSSTPIATRLLAHTASGALTVIRSASASAASTTVPSGTTWLIRPHLSASAEAHRLAGEEQLHRDLARQLVDDAEHAAGRGDQPALDLGQPELRAFLGDHEIAGERQFGAAAERGAVDRGDGRLVDVVVDVPGETPLAVLGVEEVLPPRDRLEIGSGAEGFTGAGDHDRAHVRVVLRLLQRVADRDADRAVDGVARLGPVDA